MFDFQLKSLPSPVLTSQSLPLALFKEFLRAFNYLLTKWTEKLIIVSSLGKFCRQTKSFTLNFSHRWTKYFQLWKGRKIKYLINTNKNSLFHFGNVFLVSLAFGYFSQNFLYGMLLLLSRITFPLFRQNKNLNFAVYFDWELSSGWSWIRRCIYFPRFSQKASDRQEHKRIAMREKVGFNWLRRSREITFLCGVWWNERAKRERRLEKTDEKWIPQFIPKADYSPTFRRANKQANILDSWKQRAAMRFHSVDRPVTTSSDY